MNDNMGMKRRMMRRMGQGIGAMPENKMMMGRNMRKPEATPVDPMARKPMRGGGLARKGVGQALAKGGLVKANGCAKRGKTRGKMI